MTTRWKHCSAEKVALSFQKLGVSVPERRELKLSLPLVSKGPFTDRDGGSVRIIPEGSKTINTFHINCDHRKFYEITILGPGSPFYK